MSKIGRVRKLLPRNAAADAGFILLSAAILCLTLLEPAFLSRLIDLALDGTLVHRLYIVFVTLGVFFLRIALLFCKQMWLYRYRAKCIGALSSQMLRASMRAKMEIFQKWTPAYLVTRLIDEPMNIDGILSFCLIDGIFGLLICLGILVIMVLESPLAAVLSLLFIMLDYVVAMKLPLQKTYKTYNEAQAKWKADTANILQGVEVIKLGDKYRAEEDNFGRAAKRGLHALWAKNVLTYLQRTFGSFCRQLGYICTIVVSALLIVRGRLDVAGFTMLLSLNNLLWSNLASAENMIPLYKYAKVTADRIVEVLDAEQEIMSADITLPERISEIGFQDVSCAYSEEGRHVLEHMSFTARRGEITTLAGYSGCGKSTVLQLLLGFLGADGGEILLDGKAYRQDELLCLRQKIGYVGQDTFLFDRSVSDNLFYFAEKTEENMKKARRLLQELELDAFIAALPEGLETVIEADSSNISGGEKQRLCIIRELLKEPIVLLLDEFTASIDVATESRLFAFLRDSCKDEVLLQAAHRPTALKESDVIYVIDGGRVREEGTHEELLARSDFYRALLASKH